RRRASATVPSVEPFSTTISSKSVPRCRRPVTSSLTVLSRKGCSLCAGSTSESTSSGYESQNYCGRPDGLVGQDLQGLRHPGHGARRARRPHGGCHRGRLCPL